MGRDNPAPTSCLLPQAQFRYLADEVLKLAGLPRPPAMVSSPAQKLLNGGVKSTLTGGTSITSRLSKMTSPAAIIPPPPVSA